MLPERMLAHQDKRQKTIKRQKAFREHTQHSDIRRARIAKIVGCPEYQVDELIGLLQQELKYQRKISLTFKDDV